MATPSEEIWGAEASRKGERQLSLADVKRWGGRRKNAGRKAAPRAKVRHRARPARPHYVPVHITLRRAKGLPSLRSERLYELLKKAIRDTCKLLGRKGFRVVHYSVQADHVHLIIEAEDHVALTRGMQSLSVRVAMRVNRRIFGRRGGRVWGDRYHRRDLGSPSQVRNALVYVINNHIKHGVLDVGFVDPCSSAAWFTGWMHGPAPPPEESPVEPAQTWLLERGWQTIGFGFIHLGEVPRAARGLSVRR